MSLGYQGKESTVILQAPSRKELSTLIRSTRSHAKKNGMDRFRVLEKGKDPDGGYRATVTAHNLNPITWIKSKVGSSESREAASIQLEQDREEAEERKRRREEEKKAEEAHKEIVRQTSIQSRRESELTEAKYSPSQRMEDKIKTAEQRKRYHEIKPTLGTRLGRGLGRAVHGVNETVTSTYGRGGGLKKRTVKSSTKRRGMGLSMLMPKGGVTTRAPAFSYGAQGLFDVSGMRKLLLPSGNMPSPIMNMAPTQAKVPGLSKAQAAVYVAVKEGSRDMDALKLETGLSAVTITRALKALRKKNLIQGGDRNG